MNKNDYTVTFSEEYIEQDKEKLKEINIEYAFYNKALKTLSYKPKLRSELIIRIKRLDNYSKDTWGYFIGIGADK